MGHEFDFCGWATRNNIKCSDGRTIMRDAFKHNDGQTVPLVWNHAHSDPSNVLGHALLENREEGVYAYCSFNETAAGQDAKEAVRHGDVNSLSIYANKLKQKGGDVYHGEIREVSLVLAGANPGARIETIIEHSETEDETALIYNDSEGFEMYHAEETKEADNMADNQTNDKTVQDVFDTFTDEQKDVVYAIVGQAVEDALAEQEGEVAQQSDITGDDEMKHSVFANEDVMENEDVLTHADMTAIITDAKRYGSMKESVLQHGIDDIEYLFPDAKEVNSGAPEWIKREDSWGK